MARSLNKVILIGNLTRDPELRYIPQGTAVCTFGLATNRQWATDAGEKKEDVEFHRLVAWNKLAEICANLLKKGRKVYVEGRLQTRTWTGQDNVSRNQTEIIISDMIILDKKEVGTEDLDADASFNVPESVTPPAEEPQALVKEKKSKAKDEVKEKPEEDEDIPF
ncbi:single-stranded DNA-binding protein [Candidatus Woesebacteria bacterium]|nr:single-stranded DNA-binding protein [Candidatus Woesebacteria bacterium]